MPSAELRRQRRESDKRKSQKLREGILDLFGRKCNKCGLTDTRVLQVDHIYRARVPRNHDRRSGEGLWRGILRGVLPKEEYQLLCANCNFLKKLENAEHFPVATSNEYNSLISQG